MFKYFVIIIIVLLSACESDTYFKSYLEIPDCIWDAKQSAVSILKLKDSLQDIRFIFEQLENSKKQYRFSNLWVLSKVYLVKKRGYRLFEYFGEYFLGKLKNGEIGLQGETKIDDKVLTLTFYPVVIYAATTQTVFRSFLPKTQFLWGNQ